MEKVRLCLWCHEQVTPGTDDMVFHYRSDKDSIEGSEHWPPLDHIYMHYGRCFNSFIDLSDLMRLQKYIQAGDIEKKESRL